MNRAEKCRMIENHGIMLKITEDGTYRTATEYEQKNGLSDGIFLPVKKYLEAGRKVGYIIDRSNRHKVMTYRAYIENDTYKIIGDSVGNSSDPENYINFEDKWSLHELILITDLFCDRYSNSEKARLLDYWCTSRSTEVEINHKNKDKHTRDVDNLEICTRSKNRVHRSNYDLIEKGINTLREAGLIFRTCFNGFSAMLSINRKNIRRALKRALRMRDAEIFLQECRTQGIAV